ncbi:MAG: PEP-CTERM sorting domain-containing protein [Candidatus Korobacteraceae bacterium]|jgi:threonine dehydrogenase-like Zn-dependent dehydrogenase
MNKLSIALLALVALLTVPSTAKADNIVYGNTNSVGVQAWTGNMAEIFTVNSPITIVALGAFDNGNATLTDNLQVGIASISGGVSTPVPSASYTFLTTGTYTSAENNVFEPIAPVTLSPGTYEVDVVGFGPSQLMGNDNGCTPSAGWQCVLTSTGTGATLNSLGGAITFDGNAFDGNTYLDYPNFSTVPNPPNESLLSGTSSDLNQFGAGTFAVSPEPSSLLLLGTGMLGLAFVAFRKAKTSGLALPS